MATERKKTCNNSSPFNFKLKKSNLFTQDLFIRKHKNKFYAKKHFFNACCCSFQRNNTCSL